MYTLLMQDDGTLICTTPEVVFRQSESLVDKMHIIVPKKYKEADLSEYQASLRYVNPANVSKIELLTPTEDVYKEDFIEYLLPITSELTKFKGEFKLYLSFLKYDAETKQKYLTHSAEFIFTVLPVEDYFTDDSSFSAIDKRIAEMARIAEDIGKGKADNIIREGDNIQLTAAGNKIGDPVAVGGTGESQDNVVDFGGMTPIEPDPDDNDDGVIEF